MSYRSLSKFFLTLSTILVLTSIVLLLYPGPKFSIEFTGGTLMEVRLPDGKTDKDLSAALQNYEQSAKVDLGNFAVSSVKSSTGGASESIRMRSLSNEEHVALVGYLQKTFGQVTELSYNTIGSSVSASLKQNSFIALTIASLAIIAYLAFAFRRLPRKMKPWKFGVLAVVGFIHDVVIVSGIFVIIGRFTNFEFDPLFVTALLTILAYSANDTIVIFDRIRANMTSESKSEDFGVTVARGLQQCVTRTINTAVAALIMLVCVFLLGSGSIHWFILALIIGTVIGAYSSYFVAASLLVYWR